ncbi:hypothetical protein ISN35_15335 [Xanthomonas translucens pv. undulosa]|uniref:DUF3653 domain-containing protein n=1 Tax=Xanthomonas campestris pv. translucens TaxID=343 RepID=UPI0009C1282B|nr:DUF3653 domain-containing protein [Xanthomonas translucens]QSQ40416.1 hypothetical protein ISN33_12100 [Xanthomonas translucens pv. translucens]QSQ48387.1 hypothetical protein ISN35_15335 [Xanthomonas translucens pv. undulosa]
MMLDTYDRVDLTGPWAGFGFQARHMFTPEGHELHPEDMVWWSLTCNIAHEWRQMMDDARRRDDENDSLRPGSGQGKVIYLRDVLRRRQEEKRSSGGSGGADAGTYTAGRTRRGPRRPRRG